MSSTKCVRRHQVITGTSSLSVEVCLFAQRAALTVSYSRMNFMDFGVGVFSYEIEGINSVLGLKIRLGRYYHDI